MVHVNNEIFDIPDEAEAVGLAAPVAPDLMEEAAPAAPAPKAVWLLGNKLLMHPCTQPSKAFAAAGEPSPWSHLAAQLLVSITWDALGRALPKHEAWHITSPALHCNAQLT